MKLNILHLMSQHQLTGAEVYAIYLGERQSKDGHKVCLISDQIHLKTKLNFTAMPLHFARSWKKWRGIYRLRRFILERKIDIVHSHSRKAAKWGWWATRLTDCALVSTIHGYQHKSLGKRFWDIYGERLIVVCENLKEALIRDFKKRPSRIQIVPNPVNIPKFPRLKVKQKTWILIGRLSGPKGERAKEFIRDVLPVFLEKDKNLRFELLGGHWSPSNIEGNKCWTELEKKYPGQVFQSGPISNLNEKIAEAGLVFGAGRIAITALGLGRPTIAFGEAAYIGIVSEQNWEEARRSNFGDISLGSLNQKLDAKQVISDINKILKSKFPKNNSKLVAKVQEHFDPKIIHENIIEIYKSARMLKRHPKPIPVLMYHQVLKKEDMKAAQNFPHKIYIQQENFEKHLKFFQKTGHETLNFEDMYKFKNGLKPLKDFPKKPLLLTFDDGYKSMLDLVAPMLNKYKQKAVLYLLANKKILTNVWDGGNWKLLTPSERQALAKTGAFEIGSHGLSHSKINNINFVRELQESKSILEKEFHKKIYSFAFTYGLRNDDSGVLVQKAGYEYALNTDQGGFHIEEDPFSIFRIPIFPRDTWLNLLKKISPSYRKRFWRTRKR